MPRHRTERIQDTVHGLMPFDGIETVVIDVLRTREIQRLRRIRQMGLSYLVYPGAEHSRLVHSIGAAHLGLVFVHHLTPICRDFLADLLSPDMLAARDMSVAALCHDLGHGPLSHAWEREVIGDDFDRAGWISKLGLDATSPELATMKWHELVGQSMLAWPDGQLHKILEQHDQGFSDRIGNLLQGKYYLPYLPRLLNSDIDVDRCDFLKRDAFMSGVAYGRYDLEWLISTCTVGFHDGRLVVGFDIRKSPRVIEQFLIARRALYDTVYYHKTVRCAEGMVSLFLQALKDKPEQLRLSELPRFLKPFATMISGRPATQDELLSLDDYALWVFIDFIANSDGVEDAAKDLGRRILARDLFKQILVEPARLENFMRRDDWKERLLRAIGPYCKGESKYYLIKDTIEFSMISNDRLNCAYFIDESHKASPLFEHESFRDFRDHTEKAVRLFTLAEAVESARKAIP